VFGIKKISAGNGLAYSPSKGGLKKHKKFHSEFPNEVKMQGFLQVGQM
jgi:hypothetical protein